MSATLLEDVLRMQRDAAALGFDWPDAWGPLAKIEEETAEIRSAMERNDLEAAKSELGDLLFSALNLARFLACSPAVALDETAQRFAQRLRAVRDAAAADGRALDACTLDELDAYWEHVKKQAQIPPAGG